MSHEITQAVLEVVEVEVAERLQEAVNTLVQLNKSSAETDLAEILQRADIDGNEMVTADELYELIAGQPIDPSLRPLAEQLTVLKSERTFENRWERWGSLLIAPQARATSSSSADEAAIVCAVCYCTGRRHAAHAS